MWSQWWVVDAPDEMQAAARVRTALEKWKPEEVEPPTLGDTRPYRGPDDLALADAIAEDLAQIRQTVMQSHRQELSRRLQQLSHRAIGIPPRPGWVVLDAVGPRSPRPLDCRGRAGLRWVVTVAWSGPIPAILPEA